MAIVAGLYHSLKMMEVLDDQVFTEDDGSFG